MSISVIFNDRQGIVRTGSSLFDYAGSLGIKVPTSCVTQGRCKECIVEVIEGMEFLTQRTPQEAHLHEKFRLSCQAKIVGESGLVRCHTMRRGKMKIERGAMLLPGNHKKMMLDPCVTRDGDRILLDGMEIDRSTGPIHGLALDLGTTTIVLRLVNLETGEIVADSSFENPQRFGGSDVMSRIQYDTDHRGKLLQRTLAGYLTHAIEEFPVDPHSIYEMVVVGNSTMRDLFFRLDVYSIGQNPYQSITEIEVNEGKRATTTLTAPPGRLLLPIHPKARVVGLPIISGHVGADTAACILAVDMMNENRLTAVMDIGTNTELIVGNKNRIVAASCPAGPAFEGGKISCGMPGLPGAIERVTVDDDGSITCNVIDDIPAAGICGSGLIDLVSELLRTGRMNSLGRFEDGGNEIVLKEDANGTVKFTESDINELAQAKGANVAGLHVVFQTYGIRFEDLDVFYLAGGFGRHLDIPASKRIGLIPNIDDSKIVQVGNASIEGACIALLSRRKRLELEEKIKSITHCRLESDPNFFNYFVDGCQFMPIDSPDSISMKTTTLHD
ncbi:MAG: ASKHA domain-containing protein [Bacteroidota bacterium]